MKGTLADRLWNRVRKGSSCWTWTGATQHGYGYIGENGKILRTHRVSWTLHHGPIPDGLCVLHHCDNPPCVRPSHLFLGTHTDNMKDMVSKGRGNWRSCDATHCVNGHEYTDANVYYNGLGRRECRICRAAHHAKYDKRIALERAA